MMMCVVKHHLLANLDVTVHHDSLKMNIIFAASDVIGAHFTIHAVFTICLSSVVRSCFTLTINLPVAEVHHIELVVRLTRCEFLYTLTDKHFHVK